MGLNSKVSTLYKWISEKVIQLAGGLFMEEKDSDGGKTWVLSLGRVSFWIVFIHIMRMFVSLSPVSAEELSVLYALLGYQGIKVGRDIVSAVRK